jgi:hypothetical protein
VKDPSPASAYVAMIPTFIEAAREVGYALAVHGSLGRDLDLIAVPWAEEAVSAEELILRLLSAGYFQGAYLVPRTNDKTDGDAPRDLSKGNGDAPAIRPHGRKAWSIHFRGSHTMYLDVSVMPRAPARQSDPLLAAAAPALAKGGY